MGYVTLQEAICPDLEPYFEFYMFFQKEGPSGQYGLWEKWEDKIDSVDAQSGRLAHLTFESRGIVECYEDSMIKQTRYIELPPDLPATIPLTLRYKVTKKQEFIEMREEISLRIVKQNKSPIFRM